MESDVTELSGGQRTKILLGKLLLEKPDILLLDEPTNYLDVQHIEWLKRYLNEYENAFILISHDIPFLNSVVNIIYHMESQKLDRYVGDYHHFEEVYAVKKLSWRQLIKRQQQEISELKDFVARNKARVSTRNMAMSRQKKLDKMEKIELMQERPKPQFLFKEARTAGKQLFCTKDLVIGYDEPLSSPLNLEMERGEKVVLTGANGIGKTTLLKSILGMIKPLDGFASWEITCILAILSRNLPRTTRKPVSKRSGKNSFLHPVRSSFSPGKMWPDHQTYREPGTCLEWRRTGKSAVV